MIALASAAVAGDPPKRIDVGAIPATVVDSVVVPVPSEVFGVLDKLGSPNWHEILRPTISQPSGERAQIAFQLGTVIAEGFIAVEAQDSESMKKIGRNVLTLAAAINVRKAVTARSNAIIEAADRKDWRRVRLELDGALHDVKGAMNELGDQQLAHLVSLGGWLRGTEAVTQVVGKNYSQERAELLRQPILLEFFQRRLGDLKPALQKNPVVGKVDAGLAECAPLIAKEAAIGAESVSKINGIASGLVRAIATKKN